MKAIRQAILIGLHGQLKGRGFTLIEVVVVLIVLGFLLAMALAGYNDADADVQAEADALRGAIRYAQSRAMGDVYSWGIQFGGGSYTLIEDNPNITTPPLPAQGGVSRTFPAGITVTASASPLRFDWRGRPVSAAITAPGGTSTPYTATQTATVAKSGGRSITISIIPYTGFVQ